jgi:hypothetical protein
MEVSKSWIMLSNKCIRKIMSIGVGVCLENGWRERMAEESMRFGTSIDHIVAERKAAISDFI